MAEPASDERREQLRHACRQALEGGQTRWIEQHLSGQARRQWGGVLSGLLAIEVECRLEAGQRPRPQEYRQRFPDYVGQVEAVFQQLIASHPGLRLALLREPPTVPESLPLPS